MIKKEIIKNLQSALTKLNIKNTDIDLDHPTNADFGDYSTTIALKLAKNLKKNPWDIAQNIVKNLPKNDLIQKTEVIKPGFINFWVTQEYLLKEIEEIIQEKINYPSYYLGKTKKIMVEYAHPNTHKLFHIGHLRNITTGESIIRLLEALENKVIRVNYQGDVGLHIAKCLYIVRGRKLEDKRLKNIRDKIKFLGEAYAQGNKAYETNDKAKEEIIEINRKIYEKDPEIRKIWEETRQWSLDYFQEIYNRVYSKFDRLYFESELPERGIKLAKEAEKKEILEKSKGALVFKGEKYGLDTRVFINSLGFPTYEGKELALAEKQLSEFGEIDKLIHVVAPEQTSFFKVTFKVEELLDPKKYKNKQHHLAYGWVRLKTGKMSSRQGKIVEGEWLINETKKKILELFKCNDNVSEVLAIASIKYSFLKNGVSNTIAFDFNESVSVEGNSGPYLIYTYVRCQSVLKKTNINNLVMKQCNNVAMNENELSLLRLFYQFPEVVEKAAQNFAPNYIATYLYNLAQKFNLFYQKYPILKAEKEQRQLRLLITKTTGEIIKKGLYLLGIKTVERM
jgi:arginyl-tRNA synthetase